MHKVLISSLLLSLIFFSSSSVSAKEMSLTSCQNTKDKIQHYNKLRRAGGKPKHMEAWKAKRKTYQEKFKRGNCKKWKSQIK